MVSITIEKVSKSFGKTLALNNVSMQINAGELFFLLGSSGCGKTTLLRHIAGFYSPDKGKILFGSDDVTTTPPHKRGTAMMFQSYALWPHMTVSKNVAFGLEEQSKSKALSRISSQKHWKLFKWPDTRNAKLTSSQADNNSEWHWQELLLSAPDAYCLTSPYPISMPNCVLRCAVKFGESARILGSLLFMSLTIKKKHCPLRIE